MLLEGWRRALLAILAGAIATLALPPFNLPVFAFVSFPILLWLIGGVAGAPGAGLLGRAAPAFVVGWQFGFGYFVAGLWWLGAAMMVDVGEFWWAIPFAVLGLPAILAFYFGFAAVLARLFWSEGAGRLFAFAAAFALAEYARGVLFTGFPWNEIGVMAAPIPLMMQSVSVVGLHGLTLGALLVFAAPALLADPAGRSRAAALALVALLVVAHLGFGAWRLWNSQEGTVADVSLLVVQPGIEQSDKWDEAEADRIWRRLVGVTLQGKSKMGTPGRDAPRSRLIVWPESAFPFILTHHPEAIADLGQMLQPGESLAAGATRLEGDDNSLAYNSVYLIDDEGAIVEARDKVHLVPFGEYLPLGSLLSRFGLHQIVEMPGGFTLGASHGSVPFAGTAGFLPLVCYEIIFPSEYAAIVAGKNRPSFILNVTNDAWYGRTPGPYQHLRQAELAAVALGLPLVRSANTGISVVNDAYGRTIDSLALGSTGNVEAPLPDVLTAPFYARYIDLAFWCAFVATCAVAIATALTMGKSN
ncbi:Apolipoprotein N-acyltransferase [Consotaella salsifontis]|uniref:Apolipoprotein N-acyltransferase n=2 Tax=Consotaella salsifontis TaxID=1365950 RepID=A0A1T4S5B8_9HYPH|nr:Apolipoprotein N-acyltransferase [Consotaella salsifontis]